MSEVMEMKSWGTTAIETASMARVQDRDLWIDTKRFSSGIFRVEAPLVSGGQIELEGCDSLGGVWDVLDSAISASTRETYILLRRTDDAGASDRMPRYIRWRAVDGGAGTFEACFRITATFK